MWNLCMAINVYLNVFKRYSAADLRKLEWTYILACYGVIFVAALVCCFILTAERRRAYGPFTVMVFGVVSVGLSVDCTWLRPSLVCSLPSTIRSALHILILPRLCIIIIFTIYVAAGIRILKKRKELRVFSNPPIEAELVGNLSSRSETTEGHITTERNRHGRTMSNVSHVHVRRINGELLTPSDGASP